MAKDGTHRGGRRAGAGRKPKLPAEKLSEDKKSVTATESQYPKPSDYLSQLQRDGSPLGADEIYTETAEWLKKRGCSMLVNPRLLESYIQLCLALSEMAKELKTASPKPQQTENPKFAMRTWLIRLGFVGEEFATARDFLTRNLDGDTAFRFGRN